MDHRNGKKAIAIPAYTSEWEGGLPLFFLIGLLPVDEALSVNTDCLVVSLVLTNSTSGNPILRQRLLTESQMRLLLTLLQSPHYCPHEVLYAGLFCSFQGLLAGLFSSEHIAREEWLTAIRETGLRLEHAEAQGMLRKELKLEKGIKAALQFALGVACQITSVRPGHLHLHLRLSLRAHSASSAAAGSTRTRENLPLSTTTKNSQSSCVTHKEGVI